ncbi:phosphoribosylaminoimidazolesuccinocarboxamide synthase [Flavobacterium wongokense]|uniref:phosphoribosylaminoimidazolesuccinocarboxamide synthase n=1 Tax=Flavobacterium wongokense TaxID=2910674 RepID=UPI001F190ED8|nr:phosphoribosylaminoimidazolesuccinocarboxamide synthase [Flavobacterium sp. WG47]MCF6131915.1 phosphoribosylaminoimidazolesuccinocarboxamide synthase [Flavobacterium sp. WG47]
MDSEKVFKTKTGFCHISQDKIILSRDGFAGNVSDVVVGNKISRILTIYGIISVFLIYTAYEDYNRGNNFSAIFYFLLALLLIFGIWKSINNSAAPIIERANIKKVEFKKGIVGLTRSRFEILFEDNNGKTKKRLILLPGSLNNGEEETKKALSIMKAEGLIK